jgi:hypothetical protein
MQLVSLDLDHLGIFGELKARSDLTGIYLQKQGIEKKITRAEFLNGPREQTRPAQI